MRSQDVANAWMRSPRCFHRTADQDLNSRPYRRSVQQLRSLDPLAWRRWDARARMPHSHRLRTYLPQISSGTYVSSTSANVPHSKALIPAVPN